MRCLLIRIGNVNSAPLDRRGLSVWLHSEDLCQLVSFGLEHPDLHNDRRLRLRKYYGRRRRAGSTSI